MKQKIDLRARWKELIDTVSRYPLTIILLVASVIINAIAINSQEKEFYIKLLVTFVLGASINVVCQLFYERFFDKPVLRIYLMGGASAFSIAYYLLIRNTHWSREVTIRTIVIFFLLLIASLWIPIIKNRINFNQSFLAVFKGFFTAAFFTGILFLGVALILGATNLLIFRINERAYIHAANIIFILFAPTYFLSFIPYYPRSGDTIETVNKVNVISDVQPGENIASDKTITNEWMIREETRNKLISPARFLETLISYIVIPITAVFTIILLLYILMNITGDFWTDNLMEPLLLSYSITVIIVYLLASNLKNAFTRYFRLLFPKVLLPVVLFQTLSSILKIGDAGVTFGRYFVILFGLFATIAAILFCVVPVRKNGIIAPILILLSLISIVPPIDAFTVSRVNQSGRLEKVLKRNDMLKDEKIIPKANISEKDKKIIMTSVSYLDRMEYTKNIKWLSSYSESYDFKAAFGFGETVPNKGVYRNVFVERDMSEPIPVMGYDYIIYRNFNNQSNDFQISKFEKEGKSYSLRLNNTSKEKQAILLEKDGQELIRFEMNDIFHKFAGNTKTTSVNTKEVTFTKENTSALLTVIAERISINEWEEGSEQFADIFILVHIK